jgi:hypothetical protein
MVILYFEHTPAPTTFGGTYIKGFNRFEYDCFRLISVYYSTISRSGLWAPRLILKGFIFKRLSDDALMATREIGLVMKRN